MKLGLKNNVGVYVRTVMGGHFEPETYRGRFQNGKSTKI